MNIAEDSLIERIRRKIPSTEKGHLQLGIGDDAAVLRPNAGLDWVVTCDQFIEDVHFLAEAYPAAVVGYKSLARATSDVAAMGARPDLFLLNLALPRNRTGEWLDKMLAGMARASREFDLRLAGGDTARASKIALSIMVMGTVERGRALRRDGARTGDHIFVSGVLGAAELGFQLVLRGKHNGQRLKKYLAPQFYPKPELALGEWLAKSKVASAAMDVSDGLSIDLSRLCSASGVGAQIYAERLPCVTVPGDLRPLDFDPLKLALHGGEDYGLLFTVPDRLTKKVPKTFAGTRLTQIGRIIRGRGMKLIGPDGKKSALAPRGWDHFREI